MSYNPLAITNSNYPWVDGGAIDFRSCKKSDGTSGPAPVKGTISKDFFRYKRFGDTMMFKIEYSQAGAGTGTGSNIYYYIIKLPTGIVADHNKVTLVSNIGLVAINEGQLGHLATAAIGHGSMQTQSNSDIIVAASPFMISPTEMAVFVNNSAVWDNDSGFDFPDIGAGLSFMGNLPIQGWS